MEFAFRQDNPVLQFKLQPHVKPGPRKDREYLLWPAWAYRVVAPLVRPRRLNVLQKAVVGLCRAGVVSAMAIGKKLHINEQLAAFILQELEDQKLLGRDALPTRKGLEALEEEELEIHEMVAGYVFQDPWTNELWPRFVEQLDYCEVEYGENGFPYLLLGTIGSPRPQRAFMLRPAVVEAPFKPTASDIVRAARGHKKAWHWSGDGSVWNDDRDDFVPTPVHIDRVSFVDETPQPVFLTTYLYLPHGQEDGSAIDWYVCDPFGIGASPSLRHSIEQMVMRYEPLKKVVDRLLTRSLHGGLESYQKWLDQVRVRAEELVELHLTMDARDHLAYTELVEMESARQEAGYLEGGSQNDRLKSALQAARRSLEAAFAELAKSFPLQGVWEDLFKPGRKRSLIIPKDKQIVADVIKAAALASGFSEPVPSSLLNIKPGHVKSVSHHNDFWRLRAAVSATVLAARDVADHPLRKAAMTNPNLLADIERVVKLAGEASHTSSRAIPREFTYEEVKEAADLVYQIVGALTGRGTGSVSAVFQMRD